MQGLKYSVVAIIATNLSFICIHTHSLPSPNSWQWYCELLNGNGC